MNFSGRPGLAFMPHQFLFSIETEEHPPWGIPRCGEIHALIGRPERTPSTPLK